MTVLQLVENEFDPIPFGQQGARMFGRMSAAVQAFGRAPRRRTAVLMIAATPAAESIPLYTTNPHVHLQVADSAALAVACGVPLAIRDFRERTPRAKSFVTRESGIPGEGSLVTPSRSTR